MTALSTDADLAKCTSVLSTALAPFAPGANSTASSSAVDGALANLCGDSVATGCPADVLNSKITDFYSACVTELATTPNKDVIRLYDVLYVVPPLQKAICSKGDDGNYCLKSASAPSGTSAATIKAALYTQTGDVVTPNTDTFDKYGVPFLLRTADSPDLCQTCTRNILSAFIQRESDTPYGPALENSSLLGSQSALFNAVQSQCGATFMQGEVKAAGGLSSNSVFGSSSGAVPRAEFQGLAALAGFASLAVALL